MCQRPDGTARAVDLYLSFRAVTDSRITIPTNKTVFSRRILPKEERGGDRERGREREGDRGRLEALRNTKNCTLSVTETRSHLLRENHDPTTAVAALWCWEHERSKIPVRRD